MTRRQLGTQYNGVVVIKSRRLEYEELFSDTYHYPCPDGALASLAASIYFKATSFLALFFPITVYRPPQLLSLDLDSVICQGMVRLSHKQKMTDDCLSKSYEIALGVAHILVIRAVVYKVLEFENDQTMKIQCQYLRDLEMVGIEMRALSC
ncbi:hypothetical protein L6164_006327 [Bauhinia variegata]|uniref:Uncharacterized protein n=1 Tax=Bauhinia variegata TaxID=167791 RepID=A0ACB9PVX8_BAUVA|nr:hypothetical protein L6164_006327 [Bauhinia variegata]